MFENTNNYFSLIIIKCSTDHHNIIAILNTIILYDNIFNPTKNILLVDIYT